MLYAGGAGRRDAGGHKLDSVFKRQAMVGKRKRRSAGSPNCQVFGYETKRPSRSEFIKSMFNTELVVARSKTRFPRVQPHVKACGARHAVQPGSVALDE